MPKNNSIRSVLIIGSGPIVIGQACEFDYSGTQAARSLRDEGIEVILINSNPATIMTDEITADHIYLLPLTTESIVQILEKHDIDAVLPTMGGQTALNLTKDAQEQGIWEKYNVQLIGVDIDAIELTENREEFKKLMGTLGLEVAKSQIANSYLEGKEAAQEIGFPLVLRPSYTLGGFGGGLVRKKVDFDAALTRALNASPTHEVLIEQAVLGWKEFELELLRDKNDNVIIICTVENLDPMGIHTGDSITVAPSMTLSDTAYQKMRNEAMRMMRSLGVFAGGCNVQFAMNPVDETIIPIEINPRVSRSSALASKATGYPIAKIAAKLAIGYTLDELKNQITKNTSAFFEPSLDYVIVKMPRWNFEKFPGAHKELGLQMKSVGEVMAIGTSFIEALQKACQSQENNRNGLGADAKDWFNMDDIMHHLEFAQDDRIYRVKDGLRLGMPKRSIHKLTKIDPWFIDQIANLVKLENQLLHFRYLDKIPVAFFKKLKKSGYSDAQIAFLLHTDEEEVSKKRIALGIRRVYKIVDTCAAEFEAKTPYYYSTFGGENESIASDKKKIIVIGSGPNRIGQGIEFDYCCVHGLLAIKEAGYEAIMINCNPETVSTDFDVADKLYFEPIFWEHIEEILHLEKPEGVIIQLGGQTALKLAEKLKEKNIKIIGTAFKDMDLAEDRSAFSDLLKELKIPYPLYGSANNADKALDIAKEIGYPVLVRPSYVLGGQRMKIVINDNELERAVIDILTHIPNNTILVDHFLERAKELEVDAICDGEDVHIMGIMEHIEPAGIHSGDSSAVLPPFSLSDKVLEDVNLYTKKLALALRTKGLINIQFATKNEKVYVIEANPRASRTTPFICKAYKIPYLQIATKIMLGTHKLKDFELKNEMDGYAIKIPVFSFNKFPEVNKKLGPEMKSTGEAIRFIKDLSDPFFRKLKKEGAMYLNR